MASIDDLMVMTEEELEALIVWMIKNKTYEEVYELLQQAYTNS